MTVGHWCRRIQKSTPVRWCLLSHSGGASGTGRTAPHARVAPPPPPARVSRTVFVVAVCASIYCAPHLPPRSAVGPAALLRCRLRPTDATETHCSAVSGLRSLWVPTSLQVSVPRTVCAMLATAAAGPARP
uniref:Uncharacterized protein n=1 Tax=Lygus hesperus TaxID=30085 RepID=A0A146MCB9_LYGHE